MIPDHPDIELAMRTGYGRFNQPESIYCEECGVCLDDMTIYEDATHDFLCKDCLLTLHEKGW
jgi:hypothetical protein